MLLASERRSELLPQPSPRGSSRWGAAGFRAAVRQLRDNEEDESEDESDEEPEEVLPRFDYRYYEHLTSQIFADAETGLRSLIALTLGRATASRRQCLHHAR